jgi:hypothetical protein
MYPGCALGTCVLGDLRVAVSYNIGRCADVEVRASGGRSMKSIPACRDGGQAWLLYESGYPTVILGYLFSPKILLDPSSPPPALYSRSKSIAVFLLFRA